MVNDHSNEPDFIWQVHKLLKKRDRLVNKVKSRCRKNRFKLGVEFPLKYEGTLRIDQENGNTLWNDYVRKDMKNSSVDSHLLDRENHSPVGYKYIKFQLIFGVKMDPTRKGIYNAYIP